MTTKTLHHPACTARTVPLGPCSYACALRTRLASATSTATLRDRLAGRRGGRHRAS